MRGTKSVKQKYGVVLAAADLAFVTHLTLNLRDTPWDSYLFTVLVCTCTSQAV